MVKLDFPYFHELSRKDKKLVEKEIHKEFSMHKRFYRFILKSVFKKEKKENPILKILSYAKLLRDSRSKQKIIN